MKKGDDLTPSLRENIRRDVARGPFQSASDPRDPRRIKIVHSDGRITSKAASGKLAPGYDKPARKK